MSSRVAREADFPPVRQHYPTFITYQKRRREISPHSQATPSPGITSDDSLPAMTTMPYENLPTPDSV